MSHFSVAWKSSKKKQKTTTCFYRKYIGKTFDPSLDIVRIIIGLNFIMYEFTNVWTNFTPWHPELKQLLNYNSLLHDI